MVVLRGDVDAANIALLFAIIHAFDLKTGTARVLWCRSIDRSARNYLAAEAKLVSSDGFADVLIPHWSILTIAGSKKNSPIGFVWESKSKQKLPPELA